MNPTERNPYDPTIEIKVRLEPEILLWVTLATNVIALIPTVYDLLTWLIQ